MRSLAVLATAVALSVSITPACGSSVPSSCGDYFDALLSVQSQCGLADWIYDPSERSDFIAACEAGASAAGSTNVASQLDECASDMKSRGCLAIVYSPPSCFVRGSLPDGSACGANGQCAGGVCVPSQTPNPSSEVKCGQCASFLPVGSACSFSSYPPCDPATSDCDGTTCVAFIPHGGACPQSGTYCAPGDECSAEGKCDTVPTLDQSCNVDCNGPYQCTNGKCVAGAAQGEACGATQCQPGLACNPQTMQCNPLPPAKAGETCGFQGSSVACDTGLICSLATQTCIAPVPLGGTCTVGAFQCSAFAACIDGACAIPDYSACK